jgi:CBS domain-containing protein
MTTIAARMSRRLLVVDPATSIGDAASQMADRNVGSVVVLEGERLVGILTERDILRAFAGALARETPVGERMTRDPETCEATESLEHAAVLMLHGGFRHLPIVEGERVIGMLSLRDVVGAGAEDRAPRGV